MTSKLPSKINAFVVMKSDALIKTQCSLVFDLEARDVSRDLRMVEEFRVTFVDLSRDDEQNTSDHRLTDKIEEKRTCVVRDQQC